jgi:alkylation response protein AidB-like acyl-CoA dehydrogenase
MFDFGLSEELALVVRTAREFAQAELVPQLRAAESARSVPESVHQAYADIGLLGLELPAALGGAGLGALARVLVDEELAAADAGAAIALDRAGPALGALLELGGEAALVQHVLPLLEQPGARALLVTAADMSNGRFAIDAQYVTGELAWAPAERVDLLVVLGDAGAIVVRDGLEVAPVHGAGLRAAGGCALSLQRAKIAARYDDAAAVARALARARLHTSALLIGVLRQAAEYSQRYALERVAFGKPIAHHQALAFLIADMRSGVDGARLLVHEAAFRAERGLPFEAAAAAAFVEAIELSRFVGPAGVQILGGHGFMQDHPVEKYMREARALGLLLGGIDRARDDAAAAIAASALPVELCAIAEGPE